MSDIFSAKFVIGLRWDREVKQEHVQGPMEVGEEDCEACEADDEHEDDEVEEEDQEE